MNSVFWLNLALETQWNIRKKQYKRAFVSSFPHNFMSCGEDERVHFKSLPARSTENCPFLLVTKRSVGPQTEPSLRYSVVMGSVKTLFRAPEHFSFIIMSQYFRIAQHRWIRRAEVLIWLDCTVNLIFAHLQTAVGRASFPADYILWPKVSGAQTMALYLCLFWDFQKWL